MESEQVMGVLRAGEHPCCQLPAKATYESPLAPPGVLAWTGEPWQAPRKRVAAVDWTVDEGVAALLPKMKRMRLKPSIGQLRLQREAQDACNFGERVRLVMEPEHLRATVSVTSYDASGGCGALQFQLAFPPQYPHQPPKILQVMPDERLRFLQYAEYDSNVVVLSRLTERCWSSAMGVQDIIRDLLEELGGANLITSGPPLCESPDDVEMS
eukprot:gnl/TRDRNA2_/TRDRNA2_191012_c0_seq1.p1 gnl/TRDRNA2_/TRDRNA2_191012_c0~~gnl/TRDRNA2_/TRDRNA2_191012_c0_seq1.p1  ORF type:complete len:212 (+),score=25.40 gnl/TRDRNA2_/TRDRNA2_191012_c0_seq1:109-744(+)